jgi:FkbM family methyltransferase
MRLAGEAAHLKVSRRVKKEWVGNQYGGFYVASDFVGPEAVVYSFGIGKDVSFDLGLIKKFGCQVCGFDPTPASVQWVRLQHLPVEFHFYEFGLASETGTTLFYLPINAEHVSGSMVDQSNVNANVNVEVEMKSLQDVMALLHHDKIDVLKMDIEGAEYDVLNAMLNQKIYPGQLLIEFHDRLMPDGSDCSRKVVDRLKQYGYQLFAVSDSLQEVSFVYDAVRSN